MSVDPRTSLTFATSHPKITNWLEIEAVANNEPDGLYADLRNAGWSESHAPLPPHEAYGHNLKPLGYQVVERTFTKRGTDLFGGWTDDERRAFMAEARKILRNHGFTKVPVWHKTLEDML